MICGNFLIMYAWNAVLEGTPIILKKLECIYQLGHDFYGNSLTTLLMKWHLMFTSLYEEPCEESFATH